MKKIVAIILVLISSGLTSFAQNAEDALRYSSYYSGNTARSAGLGGAMGALGGDQGSFLVNPAGLGVFRKSELSFTPYMRYITSESNVEGQNSYKDFAYGMGIKQAGYVAVIPTYNETGLISVNLNFSYNQQNSFKKYTGIRIFDASSSLLDDFTADANNGNWYYTGNELAFATDLIYDLDGTYYSDLSGTAYGQDMRRSIQQHGTVGEYQAGLAANFNNNLFIGLNMGINALRYSSSLSHTEFDIPPGVDYLNSFDYSQVLKTTGIGFTARAGIIYTPVTWLRLGIAAHTPSFYSLEDYYEASINADLTLDDPVKPDEANNSGRFDYTLVSPPKIVFSGGLVFGKHALVSVDYDITDYSVIRLRSDMYDFVNENDDIQSIYTITHNFKAGAEFRFGMMSYRAGFAYYQSPYKVNEVNASADRMALSGGIGINNGDYFVDISYVNTNTVSNYILYQQPMLSSRIEDIDHQFLFTIGYRF